MLMEATDHMDLGTSINTASERMARRLRSSRRLHLRSLHLRLSERKLLLAGGDLLAVNLGLLAALAFRPSDPSTSSYLWGHLSWFVLLSGLWLLIGLMFSIYDLARAASPMHSLWAAGQAAMLTGVLYFFMPYVTPAFPERRVEFVLFPLIAVLGVAGWRVIYATVFVQPAFQQRALVVGAGWAGRTLAQAIAETGGGNGNPYRGTGYRILGFVDDDPAKQGQEIEGAPVLGMHCDLVRLVQELRPDELVLAITHSQTIHVELFQAVLDCREAGIPVTTMASLYERMTGRTPVEHAGRDLDVVLPLAEPASHRVYMACKRLFDLAASLVGCVLVAVLCPVIWLANRLTVPGDLLYRQERIGSAGKPFHIIKFRSMVMDAEEDTGAVWAKKNDFRVTPVGRVLRKLRLDELPQFWNVLRGEMSLIGPRPERPEFVTKLARKIPFYRVRHAVKPGITGWAQVKYRYGSSVDDSLVKLQYDLYYIRHEGPYLDLLILLKTVQTVLGLRGL
jgi:exopolysaccharide biosynthesis polyprenyl glycosylphosphotransferase